LQNNDLSQTKRRWSRRKRALAAIGIVAGIAIPLFGFLAWDYSTCPIVIFVPAGTNLSVSPGQHLDYNFTVNKVILGPNRPIYMVLSADNSVTMYVMTMSQFTNFNSTKTANSYVWTSGAVTSARYEACSKGCPLNPPSAPLGTNYFVIYNPNTSVVAKVSVSEPIELGSC